MTESNVEARCRVIREMLERWDELNEQSETGRVAGGAGVGVALSPHEPQCLLLTTFGDQRANGIRCTCAYQCVRELERLLRLMRDDRAAPLVTIAHGQKRIKASVRSLWWHLNQRYIAAPTRIETAVVREKVLDKHGRVRRGKDGQVLFETRHDRKARKVVNGRVDERLVTAGVVWIAGAWALPFGPRLPSFEMPVAA